MAKQKRNDTALLNELRALLLDEKNLFTPVGKLTMEHFGRSGSWIHTLEGGKQLLEEREVKRIRYIADLYKQYGRIIDVANITKISVVSVRNYLNKARMRGYL